MNKGVEMPIKLLIVLGLALLVFVLLSGTLTRIPGLVENSTKTAESRLGLTEDQLAAMRGELCPSKITSGIETVIIDSGDNARDGSSVNLEKSKLCPNLNGGSCIVYEMYRLQRLDSTVGRGAERGEFNFEIIRPAGAGSAEMVIFSGGGEHRKNGKGQENINHEFTVTVGRKLSQATSYILRSDYTHYEGGKKSTKMYKYNFTANVEVCCQSGQKFVRYPSNSNQIASGNCVDEGAEDCSQGKYLCDGVCKDPFQGPCPAGTIQDVCGCKSG